MRLNLFMYMIYFGCIDWILFQETPFMAVIYHPLLKGLIFFRNAGRHFVQLTRHSFGMMELNWGFISKKCFVWKDSQPCSVIIITPSVTQVQLIRCIAALVELCNIKRPFGNNGQSCMLLDPLSNSLSKYQLIKTHELFAPIMDKKKHCIIWALSHPLVEKPSQFEQQVLCNNDCISSFREKHWFTWSKQHLYLAMSSFFVVSLSH